MERAIKIVIYSIIMGIIIFISSIMFSLSLTIIFGAVFSLEQGLAVSAFVSTVYFLLLFLRKINF